MIKRSIPVDLWNQKKECSKGKDRVATELNHYISTVRAKDLKILKKVVRITLANDWIKKRSFLRYSLQTRGSRG